MGTMLWQNINKTCLNISISYNLYCLILDNVQLGDAPCAVLKASYLLSYRWRSLCHRIRITMMPLLSHTINSFTCILKYIQSHLLVRVMEFHGLGCCFSCFDILFQLIELDWCLSLLKCPREALQTIHGILIEYNLTYPKWKKQHLDLSRVAILCFIMIWRKKTFLWVFRGISPQRYFDYGTLVWLFFLYWELCS